MQASIAGIRERSAYGDENRAAAAKARAADRAADALVASRMAARRRPQSVLATEADWQAFSAAVDAALAADKARDLQASLDRLVADEWNPQQGARVLRVCGLGETPLYVVHGASGAQRGGFATREEATEWMLARYIKDQGALYADDPRGAAEEEEHLAEMVEGRASNPAYQSNDLEEELADAMLGERR